MNPALWVAKRSRRAADQYGSDSNNLANVNTTGFKKGRAVFEDLLYQTVSQVGAATSQNTQAPSGLELGTGVSLISTEKVYTQGNLNQTGNALDLADQRQRLLPGAAARRFAGLYARRQLSGQFHRAAGYGQRLFGAARDPRFRRARRASPSDPTARCRCSWPTRPRLRRSAPSSWRTSINPAGFSPMATTCCRVGPRAVPRRPPAGVNGLGALQQGYTESSNVDVVRRW